VKKHVDGFRRLSVKGEKYRRCSGVGTALTEFSTGTSPGFMAALDGFEGSMYLRQRHTVRLKKGGTTTAFVYVLILSTAAWPFFGVEL
jgi:hypothetical protein